VGNAGTPMLNALLRERIMKYRVTEAGVQFNDKIILPFEPMTSSRRRANRACS
jgi:hypothetical protein